MQILTVLLYIVEIVVSFLLIGVVLLQRSKQGATAGITMGGGMGEAVFGANVGNVLTKATIILGVIFLANTLFLSILTMKSSGSVVEGVKAPAAAPMLPQMPNAAAPAAVPAQAPAK